MIIRQESVRPNLLKNVDYFCFPFTKDEHSFFKLLPINTPIPLFPISIKWNYVNYTSKSML